MKGVGNILFKWLIAIIYKSVVIQGNLDKSALDSER